MIKRRTKTGDSKTRLYHIWRGMITRTTNPHCAAYKYYGAKNIKVCEEWSKSFLAFKTWAYLFGGYKDDLTIERLDNSKGYCRENCTWIPLNEQWKNRTFTKRGKSAASVLPSATR